MPSEVTGLVLAGGRGSRMGGVDKGLQSFRGVPLALHAAKRLTPQVSTVLMNANRHLERYASFGFGVFTDDNAADFAGPLAGFMSGLDHCPTPYLVTVPCDCPCFPADLVTRLAASLVREDADIAVAECGHGPARSQPAFCFMKRSVRGSLADYMRSGGRKIDTWVRLERCALAGFDDEAAFFNANTLADLERLHCSTSTLS